MFLHAEGNTGCVQAAARYGTCLTDARSFAPLTLERMVAALRKHATGAWTVELDDRYLGWKKIDALLAS